MISARSKWLFCGVALTPIALGTIFSIEFAMLHKMRTEHLTPQELAQYQLKHFAWLPNLIPVAIVGGFFAVVALISLVFDNRRNR